MRSDMKQGSAKRWARFGLGLGATLSVLGNETHTVLTPSPVNVVIRIVLAFVWPAALFVAVEIFVRVTWRAEFLDRLGQGILLGPVSVVAAVVSYQHIHALMILGGEDGFSALIGPVAIDGLMLGSTVALLAIRAGLLEVGTTAAPEISDAELDTMLTRWALDEPAADELALAEAMSADAPAERKQVAERKARTPRDQAKPEQVEIVKMMLAGEHTAQSSTERRFARVIRALTANPHADIDAKTEHVHPALIDLIREYARVASVR